MTMRRRPVDPNDPYTKQLDIALGYCTCDAAYFDRGLCAHDCARCQCEDEVRILLTQRDALLKAAKDMLKEYVDLVNCGDCGHWDPETEPAVINLRAAIDATEGGGKCSK